MPITITGHGGLCCGIKHLHGFGDSPTAAEEYARNPDTTVRRDERTGVPAILVTKLQALDTKLESWNDRDNRAAYGPGNERALEVVLTDRQAANWNTALVERGFRKTFRFHNANSRNHCNVYIKHAQGFEVFDATPLPQALLQQGEAGVQGGQAQLGVAAVPPVAPARNNAPLAVGDRVVYVGTHWRTRRNQAGVVTDIRVPAYQIGILFDNVNLRGDFNPTGVVYAMRDSVRREAEAVPAVQVATPAAVVENGELVETRRQLTLRTEELRITRVAATDQAQANARLIEERDRLRDMNGTQAASIRTLTTQLEQAERRVAAPPERAVIFSDYFADLRVGGRKGPYPGLAEVREHFPRCRNFSRRDIYNNGDVEIVRQEL